MAQFSMYLSCRSLLLVIPATVRTIPPRHICIDSLCQTSKRLENTTRWWIPGHRFRTRPAHLQFPLLWNPASQWAPQDAASTSINRSAATSQPCRQTTDSRSPARIKRNKEALLLHILSLQQQLDKYYQKEEKIPGTE
ncbi:hypothetical protein V8C34DRAFT_278722 [Trichoderma compactum]